MFYEFSGLSYIEEAVPRRYPQQTAGTIMDESSLKVKAQQLSMSCHPRWGEAVYDRALRNAKPERPIHPETPSARRTLASPAYSPHAQLGLGKMRSLSRQAPLVLVPALLL